MKNWSTGKWILSVALILLIASFVLFRFNVYDVAIPINIMGLVAAIVSFFNLDQKYK